MNFHSDISTFALHRIRDFVHRTAGIVIGSDKTALVTGRLWRRLAICGLSSYDAYVDFIARPEGAEERGIMLDLLTTNETYFFREPAHFDFLRNEIIPQQRSGKMRVWCAAASTGEEPYSIAMVLTECLGNHWELLATDISTKVVEQARKRVYRTERINHLPADYLKQFCRRGVGDYDGMLAVVPSLREQVKFELHNLLHSRPESEQFDVIFLRNVLIYFDNPTKQQVLTHALRALRPGGWLILGHCESLQGLQIPVDTLRPSIYRKPAIDKSTLTRIAS